MIGRLTTGKIEDLTTDDGKNAAVAHGRQGAGARDDGQEAIGDRQEGRKELLEQIKARRQTGVSAVP
jgi:hypothetical protein